MTFFVFRCYSMMLFMFSLFLGIVVSLFSVSFFSVWVGMEVSFLGVIGMLSGYTISEVESVMKYFIIQVIGSLLFLLGIVFMNSMFFLGLEMFFIIMGLCMKIGLFPFHFWVPAVMCQMSWWGCLVVSVFQKVVPLWVISNLFLSGSCVFVFEFILMVTALLGCLGGLGILHFRALLGYSSLIHSGFMSILSLVSSFSFLVYLFVYFILNLGLILVMWFLGIYSVLDVLKVKSTELEFMVVGLSLFALSLAGLPPFTGSFLKSYFLLLCWSKFPLVSLVFMLSSGVSLYFYMSLFMCLGVSSGSGMVSSLVGKFGGMKVFLLLSLVVNLFLGWPLFLFIGII